MNWKFLTSEEELMSAIDESHVRIVAIFKHSTRCSVSLMAKRQLENTWDAEDVSIYFLDLLKFRHISDAISIQLDVEHQSPQLIGVKNGETFYHASHAAISNDSFKSAMSI